MSVGKIIRKGLSVANVVATGTATAQVTPGRTIENIVLKMGGTFTKAMITMVRVRANGRTIVEATGTELDKLFTYRGTANGATYLEIPFQDEGLKSYMDGTPTAFDTSQGITNITVEVSISGATSPTLEIILSESAAQRDIATGAPAPYAGMLGKILRYPFAVSTGGTLSFNAPFGKDVGAVIKRVHVVHANMTGATVKQDGLIVHESLLAENSNYQTSRRRTPQANFYTIDFTVDGYLKNSLDTRDARSIEWLFTFSAADSGFILIEYMDRFDNL